MKSGCPTNDRSRIRAAHVISDDQRRKERHSHWTQQLHLHWTKSVHNSIRERAVKAGSPARARALSTTADPGLLLLHMGCNGHGAMDRRVWVESTPARRALLRRRTSTWYYRGAWPMLLRTAVHSRVVRVCLPNGKQWRPASWARVLVEQPRLDVLKARQRADGPVELAVLQDAIAIRHEREALL